MNFFTVIILGYLLIAAILICLIYRDRKNPEIFFGKHKNFALFLVFILTIGIILAVDARFIEPNLLVIRKVEIKNTKITTPVRIVFITDPQVGNHKKTAWAKKIVKKIDNIKPDIVVLGGDLIDNEWTSEDESIYLEPLEMITSKYPTYAVLGNHEYGLGTNNYTDPRLGSGNRSAMVITRLDTIGVQLLKNDLSCINIKDNNVCLYGIDDLWGGKVSFENLKKWDQKLFLIFITHNPDGVLQWPKTIKPDLILAGHTHNGQIFLPLIGPLGDSGVNLGRQYYYGQKTWEDTPMFISSGAGESGGPVRLFNPPEIAEINVLP